jgi:hypothetical protein
LRGGMFAPFGAGQQRRFARSENSEKFPANEEV